MDGTGCSPAVSPITDSEDDTRELPESIELLDTVLKDMLLSVSSTLQADTMTCMHRFNSEIQAVESRVEHIENKMGEYASIINDLVDSNEEKEGG